MINNHSFETNYIFQIITIKDEAHSLFQMKDIY